MKIAAVCFLIRDNEICLGLKKRGFGMGKYNGFGGKVGDKDEFRDETVEESIKREGKEEFGIEIIDLKKVAELTFVFPHNPNWDHFVHVHTSSDWGEKDPEEGEEMSPKWFKISEIPYGSMWDDDKFWLPKILSGKVIEGYFEFDSKGRVTKKKIEVLNKK